MHNKLDSAWSIPNRDRDRPSDSADTIQRFNLEKERRDWATTLSRVAGYGYKGRPTQSDPTGAG